MRCVKNVIKKGPTHKLKNFKDRGHMGDLGIDGI